MAATARQCAITLLPNIGFSYRFLTPGNLFRAVITSIINISQSYGDKKNVAPGKRHIVIQCNNNDLFNKQIKSLFDI